MQGTGHLTPESESGNDEPIVEDMAAEEFMSESFDSREADEKPITKPIPISKNEIVKALKTTTTPRTPAAGLGVTEEKSTHRRSSFEHMTTSRGFGLDALDMHDP